MVVDNFFRIVDNYKKTCGKLTFYDKNITKKLKIFIIYTIIFFKNQQKFFKNLRHKKFIKTIDKYGNYGV